MMEPDDGPGMPSRRQQSFVGRAAPLGVLQRCLGTALSGRPHVVFVEGDPGIGKSRLVAELLTSARGRGASVLAGHCREDSTIPYLPIATALAPLGEELGEGALLVDPAAACVGDVVDALDPRPATPIVAACRAAVGAATRRPVVIVVEDLHWADPPTADLFEQLVTTALIAGTTASTPILVVATLRPPSGATARIVERLRRESDVSWVRVVGMDELELNDLLTSLGPARPSRSLLSAVAEATDGNPLLAKTLYGRLAETGGLGVRDGEVISLVDDLSPMAGGLDAELRRRLDAVGEDCRSLLTVAAFIGDGGLLADLEAVIPTDIDALLAEAEAAGLLDDDGVRYRFDHPVLRRLLYTGPGGRSRQRLHLEIADHLELADAGSWSRATEIADHLRKAGPQVDRARLARVCRAAGSQAYSLGAWGAAARYLDVAIEADPPDGLRERAELALRAGVGHFRDHDLAGTEQRLLEAIADARMAGHLDVWASAALLLTRARVTIGPGSVGAGVDTTILEELLQAIDSDDRRAGEAVGLLAEVHFHAFDFAGGWSLLDDARRRAEHNEDDDLATNVEFAAGLQQLGRLEVGSAQKSFWASVDHASRLADPWKRAWGLGRLPLVEMMRGELIAAETIAGEAGRLATSTHDWAEHALATACRMQVAAARAEYAAAETAGAVALQMYRRSDYSFVPILVYLAFAASRSARGDVAGADEALDEWAELGGRSLAPYRLLVLASTGDPADLADSRTFRPVGDRPVNLFTLPTLCAQVEVGMTLGDTMLLDDARGPLTSAHRIGIRWSAGWPMQLSRLLAGTSRVLGRSDDAARWCDVAAAEATASGAAGELARVSLERARLADARGDNATATAEANSAAAEFDRLGMLPLAIAAQRIGGPGSDADRVLRTIMFTDLVGSTAMNLRTGDTVYLELLGRHNRILRRRLRQFDGVELKHTGDGIGAWFTSPAAAAECALVARDDLAEHNVSHPETPLLVRFGLASGTPIPHEGDLYGISMSLAARMCQSAAPNQVLVSADVAESAGGGQLTFRPLGPIAMKGFPEPLPAFAAERAA